MNALTRKVAAEFVATFLFVFSIIAVLNSGANGALPIGFALMVLVYATGHISGGHLNPAVSFGALIRGALNVTEFIGYAIAQIVGGLLAAFLSMSIWAAADSALVIEAGPAFGVELIFTFILVYVVLNVATSKDHPNNSFYGLAIGSVVFVGASAVGGISGAAFNPAVSIALAADGILSWGDQWLYIVAPLIGGALAAVVFRLLNADDVIKADA